MCPIVRLIRFAGALLALALLAGCGQPGTPPPTEPTTVALAPAPTALPTTAPAPTATPPPTPTAIPLPTWTPIPTPVAGVLFVDAGQERGPISPLVYGSGYGPWVSLRPQTIPLAQESGVTVLRYPGGAWGDQNDLQAYHIDQFVGLARELVGAEPYVHVRFLDRTPEYAASVVRYANVDKGYGIKYWSIGNEPSLYEAAGDGWTAAEFAAEWRKFAEAMKAVDPTILLVGPEIHQWAGLPGVDPKDSTGADWLRTFLPANGDLVDIVSIHRYPFPNNARRTSAEPDELRADAAAWTGLVRRLRDVVRTETGRDLPIAITEFNSHWSNSVGGDTTPDSHLSAIWLGDVLGRLIAEQVDMANQFLLVTAGDQGFGLLDRYGGRPAYFVYQLFKQFGDELIYSSTDNPLTTVYAARRDDGALTILLVNLGAEEVTKPLVLAGFTPTEDAEVWLFDKDHQAEQVGTLYLEGDTEITLPAESMTLLVAK